MDALLSLDALLSSVINLHTCVSTPMFESGCCITMKKLTTLLMSDIAGHPGQPHAAPGQERAVDAASAEPAPRPGVPRLRQHARPLQLRVAALAAAKMHQHDAVRSRTGPVDPTSNPNPDPWPYPYPVPAPNPHPDPGLVMTEYSDSCFAPDTRCRTLARAPLPDMEGNKVVVPPCCQRLRAVQYSVRPRQGMPRPTRLRCHECRRCRSGSMDRWTDWVQDE